MREWPLAAPVTALSICKDGDQRSPAIEVRITASGRCRSQDWPSENTLCAPGLNPRFAEVIDPYPRVDNPGPCILLHSRRVQYSSAPAETAQLQFSPPAISTTPLVSSVAV